MSLNSEEFLAGLAEAFVFLTAEATVQQRERADRIARRAAELAPVLTGALRESIKLQGEGIDKGMPYVDVGTTEDYANFVEYGDSRQSAQPFMRPAIAEER